MATPTTLELESAAKTLASGLSPQDAAAMVMAQYNASLKATEDAKTHALSTFTAPDWAAFKAYLMDGGGVVEDSALAVELLTALVGDDQATFFRDLPHLFKSWMKIHGFMVSFPGGGVFFRGVSSSPNPGL